MGFGNPAQRATILGAARAAIGIAFVAAPRAVGRLLIGKDAESPGAMMFIRAFGARDVVLGVGTLRATDRESTRRWLIRAGLVDTFDAVAAVAACYRRPPGAGGAVAFTASAIPAGLNLDTARRLGGARSAGGAVSPLATSPDDEPRRRPGAAARWMYRGGRPNRLARALNRAWGIAAVAGLWPNRLNALEVHGRRSGRLISFPVMVADHEGERYLVAMFGERANWVRNVRAADGQAVLRHGCREAVRLEEVDADARAPILRRYVQVAPGGRPHIAVDRRAPLAEFERIAPRYPVFRVVADSRPPNADAAPTAAP